MSEARRCFEAGQPLVLRPSDFVAEGGQARVYARDGKAYKLFKTAVPEPSKLAALRALARPGLVAPGELLSDENGAVVGFSMELLSGWQPLVRLIPRSYRERHGLDTPCIGALVLQLRDLVCHAHDHDACIVDLNELNVLVSPDHRQLALIDVDSWQLPGHPASAIAPSVQDHRRHGFDADSDWYAFAVTTFQLFSGIHPYRGRHPGNPDLATRVKRLLSVFHPDTVVPPMAELRVPWRAWYEQVFAHGHRGPPPLELTTPDTPWLQIELPGAVQRERLFELPEPILGVASWTGQSWLWTRGGLYQGRRKLGTPPAAGALPVRAPQGGIAFVGASDLAPYNEVEASDGHLFARLQGQLLQLELTAWGLTSRLLSGCHPRATHLYRGCAVTSVLGSAWLTVLGDRHAEQVRRPELDGETIVDAEHHGGVTVVVTGRPGAWTRHVFGADGHRAEATDHPEAHVRVLPTGIALLQQPDGIELCRASAVNGPRRTLPVPLPHTLELLDGRPGYREGRSWMQLSVSRG